MANAKIKIHIVDELDQTVALSEIETSPLVLDSLEEFRLSQKTVIPAAYELVYADPVVTEEEVVDDKGNVTIVTHTITPEPERVMVTPETVIYKYTDIANIFKTPVKEMVSRIVEQCPPVSILEEQAKIQAAHELILSQKKEMIKG
jgi:hypothetical protein